MKHLLVIRFSALGDVAMTIPVIHACACQHPELRITVLSREFVRPLFERMPANVSFVGADLKGRHKGIGGLNRLFAELRPLGIDAVADLHDVLRSKYLRMRFRLAGIRTAHIDKGRREKKALTDAVEKKLVPLKSSFERYADVLRRLGLDVTPRFSSLFGDAGGDLRTVVGVTGEKGTDTWVGIAPFAAHRGKVYPLEQMEQVVAALAAAGCRVFLFGAGASERALLEQWEQRHEGVRSLAGKMRMVIEREVMSHLDVMVSMDSANMHLASLVGTPVLSVWGATHPYAGFMGWGQTEDRAVQLDLNCRPCSIYGNRPCLRDDYACLTLLRPETLVERIKQLIESKKD